jgi:hypothetical protein
MKAGMENCVELALSSMLDQTRPPLSPGAFLKLMNPIR